MNSEFTSDQFLVHIGTKGEVIDFVSEVELMSLFNDFAKCYLISRMS